MNIVARLCEMHLDFEFDRGRAVAGSDLAAAAEFGRAAAHIDQTVAAFFGRKVFAQNLRDVEAAPVIPDFEPQRVFIRLEINENFGRARVPHDIVDRFLEEEEEIVAQENTAVLDVTPGTQLTTE